MMYEMLTGTLPFVSDTAVSVAMKQVSDIAKKPSEIVDTIPKGLEQIVTKAIEKRPADRYQTAEEMIADLDKFKANPDIDFHYDDLQDEKTQFAAVDKVNKTKSKKTKVRKTPNPSKGEGCGYSLVVPNATESVIGVLRLSGIEILETQWEK